jgi:hypothetical protein
MRFEVLTAVSVIITVLWVVTSFGLVCKFHPPGVTGCLHLPDSHLIGINVTIILQWIIQTWDMKVGIRVNWLMIQKNGRLL